MLSFVSARRFEIIASANSSVVSAAYSRRADVACFENFQHGGFNLIGGGVFVDVAEH